MKFSDITSAIFMFWQDLSSQGKLYLFCQLVYFVLIIFGLRILLKIKRKLD